MVGSKSFSNSGFCWADEVEREEEESRIHLHKPEKSNPFGSARPREVVLQEKGVDWRKLDEKLHQPSIPRKEKQLKENVPARTEPVGRKNSWSPRTTGVERNEETTRVGCSFESGIPQGCLTFQCQNVDSLVPPLRYPPKNIMLLMKDKQWSYNARGPETSLLNSAEFHIERHRENKIHELRTQSALNPKRLDTSFQSPHCYSYSGLHEENLRTENGESFAVEEVGNRAKGEIRNVRSSPVPQDREWRNMSSNSNGKHFFEDRFPGPILVRGRREAADEIWGERGNEYRRTSCDRENLRRSPPISKLPNGGRLGYRHLNKEAGFGGNYRNVQVRPLEEEYGNENMEYLYGRQRFDAREFEGPRTGMVDRGRAEYHRDMDKAGFGRNTKKRGSNSRSNTSYDHQRRRT